MDSLIIMKRADCIAGLLGLALTGYVWIITGTFPEDQVVRVGPAFFPRILAVCLGLSCLVLLIKALVDRQVISASRGFSFRDPGFQRAVIALAATVVYCFVLEPFGFIVASIIYLLFLMSLLKDRKYLQMLLTAVAVTLTLYLIFSVFLHITLPMGSLYGF